MTTRDHKSGLPPRGGRYERQPGNFSAFIPAPLPPDPPVDMGDHLWGLLSDADRALGRLDGATEIVPNPDLFVFMYVRNEAVLSSQIEGTQASLIDLLEYEADIRTADDPADVEEVVNYVAAMRYGLQRLSTLPVSLRLIREIHDRLLRGVRGAHRTPGEFRTTQNWIGAAGSTIATARFVPPPPHRVVDLMGQWEDFVHGQQRLPALVKVGLAHAQFETIHPFLDGNGRVGRLLITFLLCEAEILRWPSLYLSHYFKRHRTEYYDRLQATRDAGDWEGWLAFFLRGVFEVSQEATRTAREIIRLREQHRSRIQTEFGQAAGAALVLLESLFGRPVLTVHHAAQATGLAYSSANRLVDRFVDAGILSEITGHRRNRRYRYEPYIDLFATREE
ncbi:MAG: Fic family protein [Hyphomicrobiales bacterium]|nr:Fic family protein [Hyphomicrobiales bacterium]MCP5370180.1 Fic family protein [Hyphomicrobiales bacterium]